MVTTVGGVWHTVNAGTTWQPIFDGEAQAKLIALACSEPPEGHARWTIRLLAEHVVERRIVPKAHFNTVARALKKTTSSRT